MWKDPSEATDTDIMYRPMGHKVYSLLCIFAISHLIFF